jgi:UDP-N-acetylglucosamine--N-acetylmuramyl-(pentapeptide) pyrophosphoryl-undecaprenol N-acetylglucosamine transferase
MRVIITAGGTGGHIYPALSILNKIKEKEPNSEFIYIGTHNRMEKDIVPAAGYQYESIEIYGFSKTMIKRDVKNISLIYKAYKKCLKIMKEFKPDVVIGVGGYVTFPVIMAANKLHIKTFIHEQNSIPGKSNKVLAKKADLIGVSFKDSIKYFNPNKCKLTGNPCGENALDIKAVSKTKYHMHANKKGVLIVQGSLGSNVINNKMKEFLSSIDNENYEVLYVTGKDYYEEFSKNKFSKNVIIVPYVDNLSALIKDMDLIVTRAGASIISEIMALRKPAIFIPSPYVANNHQYYNALSIKDAHAGAMIEEKDLNKDILKNKINEILNDKKLYAEYESNLAKMSIDNSSTYIYELLKELIKK